MRKLFVHQPLFRLLSPIISGVIIYLLVLLLNNNVAQVQEQFFNEELYFCIALSYIIQEFSRGFLILCKKMISEKLTVKNIFLQIFISTLLCVLLSTISIIVYFEYILGFSASKDEIYVFDSIFCTITFFYILLYISHQYLYKVNTEKLSQEKLIRQNIEEEFQQFKKGINPDLLFESFETLLVLIKTDKERSDDFIDHLATIYRYILNAKEKQLEHFKEEFKIAEELIELLNFLPYHNITLKNRCNSSFLIASGSLIYILEKIIKSTIISIDSKLVIDLYENETVLIISYPKNDKIAVQFDLNAIEEIVRTYQIYNTQKIEIIEEHSTRQIILPKLKIANKK